MCMFYPNSYMNGANIRLKVYQRPCNKPAKHSTDETFLFQTYEDFKCILFELI